MTRAYIDEYIKHFQVSDPAEEFDDRGALYCLRFDMHSSSLYPGNLRFRGM
jgi:protein-ribulosamine 3-kinase